MKLSYYIVIDPGAGETERYAAEELRTYLQRIDRGRWRVVSSPPTRTGSIYLKTRGRTVRPRVPVRAEDDWYTIEIGIDRVVLSGGSPRALLFAVYAFLEALGCRWFAPGFDSYKGIGHEFVPRKKSLPLSVGRRVVQPSMLYRDWLIEECRSHTVGPCT